MHVDSVSMYLNPFVRYRTLNLTSDERIAVKLKSLI